MSAMDTSRHGWKLWVGTLLVASIGIGAGATALAQASIEANLENGLLRNAPEAQDTADYQGSVVSEPPSLAGQLVDLARAVGDSDRRKIVAAMDEARAASGKQAAVLVVRTVGDESIEQFGKRVAASWKLDRGAGNRTHLVVVALEERDARLFAPTGRGIVISPRSSRDSSKVGALERQLGVGDVSGAVLPMLAKLTGRETSYSRRANNGVASASTAKAIEHSNAPATETPRIIETNTSANNGSDTRMLQTAAFAFALVGIAVLIGGVNNKLVLWYDWGDFWTSASIFLAGVVGLIFAAIWDGDDRVSSLIAAVTCVAMALLAIKTVYDAVRYNRNLPLGLLVGVFKILGALMALLSIVAVIGRDYRGSRKGGGGGGALPILLVLGLLALVWLLIERLVNGKRVYAAKGWPVLAQ